MKKKGYIPIIILSALILIKPAPVAATENYLSPRVSIDKIPSNYFTAVNSPANDAQSYITFSPVPFEIIEKGQITFLTESNVKSVRVESRMGKSILYYILPGGVWKKSDEKSAALNALSLDAPNGKIGPALVKVLEKHTGDDHTERYTVYYVGTNDEWERINDNPAKVVVKQSNSSIVLKDSATNMWTVYNISPDGKITKSTASPQIPSVLSSRSLYNQSFALLPPMLTESAI